MYVHIQIRKLLTHLLTHELIMTAWYKTYLSVLFHAVKCTTESSLTVWKRTAYSMQSFYRKGVISKIVIQDRSIHYRQWNIITSNSSLQIPNDI